MHMKATSQHLAGPLELFMHIQHACIQHSHYVLSVSSDHVTQTGSFRADQAHAGIVSQIPKMLKDR